MPQIPQPPRSAPSRASRTTPRRKGKRSKRGKKEKKKTSQAQAAAAQEKRRAAEVHAAAARDRARINIGRIVLPVDRVDVPKPQRDVLTRGALQSGAPFYSPYASANMGAASRRRRQRTLRDKMQRQAQQRCDSSLGWPAPAPAAGAAPTAYGKSSNQNRTSGLNNLVGRRAGTAPAGARRARPRVSMPPASPSASLAADAPTAVVTPLNPGSNNNDLNNSEAAATKTTPSEYTLQTMYDDPVDTGTFEGTYVGSPDARYYGREEEEELGVTFGSPRLNKDFASKQRVRENLRRVRLERDADLAATQGMDHTVFFHSTGLQAQAISNFTAEAVQRAERRARFLSQLEERMVKAVEKDYTRMRKRVQVLQDQRDMRRALQEAYREEDAWISDLRERRRADRMAHQKAADDTEAQRRSDAAAYAEQQRKNRAYIEQCKVEEVARNQATRDKLLRQRQIGVARAIAYKNGKLEGIRQAKRKEAKKKRAAVTRRRRKIEKNLQQHKVQTERIERLLEYRNMYNSEMARVYEDLSAEVREMRDQQRARNVFSAGDRPATRFRQEEEEEEEEEEGTVPAVVAAAD